MPVSIAVQVISVPWVYITPAITGHPFKQFGDFLGDPVSPGDLATEK